MNSALNQHTIIIEEVPEKQQSFILFEEEKETFLNNTSLVEKEHRRLLASRASCGQIPVVASDSLAIFSLKPKKAIHSISNRSYNKKNKLVSPEYFTFQEINQLINYS